MTRTFRAYLAYDGTQFFGSQVQKKGLRTVESVVEAALKKIFQKKVRVVAASRTDRGVHAQGQVIHFKISTPLMASQIRDALNHYLPKDIAVYQLNSVYNEFNARRDAKAKLYRYGVYESRIRSVFHEAQFWRLPYKLNLAKMKKAAKAFKGKHDFTAFCNSDDKREHRVRTIERLTIQKKGKEIYFEIKANGFLKQMVRIIVGTLVEVGRGNMDPNIIPEILKSKNRKKAGPTAKAHGLTLVRVYY